MEEVKMINEKDLVAKISKEADMNINGKMYMSVDRLIQITKDMPKLDAFYLRESGFKELKPGMLIHFETNLEQLALLIELDRLGYFWNGYGVRPVSHFLDDEKHDCYNKDRYIGLAERKDGTKIIFAPNQSDINYHIKRNMELVEISDLIIHPEDEDDYKK